MKKRSLLWALPLLLLLGSAFLIPRLLLARERAALLTERRQTDGSAWLIKAESGDIIRLLSLMAAPDSETISLHTDSAEIQAARLALRRELGELARLEAVPPLLSQELASDDIELEVQHLFYIHPDSAAMLELWFISFPPWEMRVWLYRDSGKILRLSFAGDPAIQQTDSLFLSPAENLERLGAAWADYYGLTVEAADQIREEELAHIWQEPEGAYPYLLRELLRDDSGNRIAFCLHLFQGKQPQFSWCSEAAELAGFEE